MPETAETVIATFIWKKAAPGRVTGDSTVTSLESEGDIVDTDGKTVSIVGTDGTVYIEGDSAYTITTGSYHDSVDLGGATAEASWSDYETGKTGDSLKRVSGFEENRITLLRKGAFCRTQR